MKWVENALMPVFLALVVSTGALAALALGNLVVKGPVALDQNRPEPPPMTAAAEPATAAPAAIMAAAATDAAPATAAAAQPEPAAAPATAEPAAAPAPAPVETAAALPDPAAGATVFKKCAACHSAEKGGKDKVGPNLWGVVNGPVAHSASFKYSDAMKSHGGNWTIEALDAYLARPKDEIPGNKMSFAGLPKLKDRHDVIAYLAAQADEPIAPETLFPAAAAGATAAGAAAADAAATDTAATDTAAADAAAAEPAAPEPVQVAYTDPPAPAQDEIAAIAEKVAALTARLPAMDYERARYDPIHFPPQIGKASNAECLVCHQEIMDHKVRETSPAGVKAIDALAWYQTLDTYLPQDGTGQSDFHWRHLESPLAQKVMNLQCNFCHKGNDPREESPEMMPGRAAFTADPVKPEFTARKMVNPSETCLRCHGAMPNPTDIMGLGGHWPEVRADMEDQTADDALTANGCLSCHAETFRTNRHNVTYLKAAGIEDLAQAGSDTCYGCHGGRAWYRISYPYPRHPWPGMDPEVPEWAKGRPTQSDPEYQRADTAASQ